MEARQYNQEWKRLFKEHDELVKNHRGLKNKTEEEFHDRIVNIKIQFKQLFSVGGGMEIINRDNLYRVIQMESTLRVFPPHLFLTKISIIVDEMNL